ncbi:hypothetical protein C8Q73DRAFT_616878, partial [Cubamyces lactineus]
PLEWDGFPTAWSKAIRTVAPLRAPRLAINYFYPPPYLLDAISHAGAISRTAPHPECARVDAKVHRFLHNLVRIQPFCRARLFDPGLSGQPLTLREWPHALWGEFVDKPVPSARGSESDLRRVKRRYQEKNGVTRLFYGSALLREYQETDAPVWEGLVITHELAVTDDRVRYNLLWEAHEVNWRCELMALDRAVVPRHEWPIIRVWEREAEVSAVWGEDSGVISVLPTLVTDRTRFLWTRPPDERWREAIQPLRAFLALMARWPGFPNALRGMPVDDASWTADMFERAQDDATLFYTRTFVSTFGRLPVVPI